MNEASFRRSIVKLLAPLDAISVENSAHRGTPDINCVEGWLELKYLPKWPKKLEEPLRVPHFTPHQRAWIYRRVSKGGKVWVLIKVGRDVLLLDGFFGAKNIGILNRAALIKNSLAYWPLGVKQAELLNALRSKEDEHQEIRI